MSKRRATRCRIPIPHVELCNDCLDRTLRAAGGALCRRCGALIRYAAEAFATALEHVEGCSPCQASLELRGWPLPGRCMVAISRLTVERTAVNAMVANELSRERRRIIGARGAVS